MVITVFQVLEEVGNTTVSSTLKTELRSSMEQSVDSRAQERVVGPFRAGLEVVVVDAKLEEGAVDIRVSELEDVIDVLRWDCAQGNTVVAGGNVSHADNPRLNGQGGSSYIHSSSLQNDSEPGMPINLSRTITYF